MKPTPSTIKNRVAANAAANLAGFAAQVVITFVLAPILIGGLGDRRYGVWALVESVLAYLTVFDLGLSASVVRYVARFEAKSDRENLNRVFSTSLFIFTLSGLVVMALSAVIASLWPDPPDLSADLIRDTRWLLLLLGFNLAVGFPLNVFASVLDGLERYPPKVLVRTLSLVARAIIFWQVIEHGGGLVALALVITVVQLIEQCVLCLLAKHYLPTLRFSWASVNWETFRAIRGYSLSAFAAMIAGRISFQTDALVIGAFMVPEYIAFFIVAARLVAYAKDALRTLTTVLTPAISALEARNNFAAIQRLLIKGTRYVLHLAIPGEIGVLVLGKAFLTLWLGEDFADKSYPVLVILSLPLALTLSQSISARVFYGIGLLRWFALATVCEALLNLGLSLAWVKPYGIEGVAWGTTIPNIIFNTVILVYVCRTVKMPLPVYFSRSIALPVVLAPAAGLVWYELGEAIGLTTWPTFAAVAAAGWAVYAVLAFAVERVLAAVLVPRHIENPESAASSSSGLADINASHQLETSK